MLNKNGKIEYGVIMIYVEAYVARCFVKDVREAYGGVEFNCERQLQLCTIKCR